MPTPAPVSGLTGTVTVGSCALIFITDITLEAGPDNEQFHTTGGGKYPLTVETAHKGGGTFNGIVDTAGLASSIFLPGELVTGVIIRSAAGEVHYTGSVRMGKFSFTFARSGEVQKCNIPFLLHGASTGDLVNTPA